MSVNIPDYCMNKFICVDERTKFLLSRLLPEKTGKTYKENAEFRKKNLELLKLHTNNMTVLLQSLRLNVPKSIKLRRFLSLADYYHWDISRNINVIYFHPSFRKGALQRRIQALGYTLKDFANEMHICPACFTAATKINYRDGSIEIFAAAFKYLTQVEREYFRIHPDTKPRNYNTMFKYDGLEVYI